MPVRVRQGAPHLLDDGDHLLEGQGTLLVDDLRQGAPLHELHRVPQERAGGAHPVDRYDVRMVERGGDLGFALEAPDGVGGVDELQGEDFEGHVAGELDLVGEIHERHAALAQQLGDLVVAAEVASQAALQLVGEQLRRGGLHFVESQAAAGAGLRRVRDVVDAAAGAGDHGAVKSGLPP